MSLVDSENPAPVIRKRNRKIQSCAECRRLKLRCDRGNPCSACVRRGLQNICPTGTVSGSWKGNRTILASTEELHERNEKLSTRIRELEDALDALQASISDQPHPLLSEELRLLKLPLGLVAGNPENAEGESLAKDEDEEQELVDTFGTLHISTDGSGLFYGTSAPSEMLMHDYERPLAPVEDELPINILLLANQFPFNTVSAGSTYLLAQMRALLPPLKDAWHLCELYFNNAAWLYRPFSQPDFVREIITPIYEKGGTSPVSGAHLSLLYITMAIAKMVDFETPAYSPTARQYQLLARACLATSNVLVDTPLVAVYAIFSLCYYLQFTDEKEAMAESLVFQGVLIKMMQSMGLHRDPEKFKLSEEANQRRRRIFWEIYIYDRWMSVMVGRPPGMSSNHIDTKMPIYPEDEGNPKGYHQTKLEIAQEYLRPFHEEVLSGSQRPKYKRVLQLDSDMRTRCVYPSELLVPGLDGPVNPDQPPLTLAQSMQRYALYIVREVLPFYLHRGYFAHALGGDKDPLESTFAPSVLATYRSARGIMACVGHAFMTQREAVLRLSWFWSHAASSAVVFAALVAFAPGSLLAEPALSELDNACKLFEQATSNRRVARFMPTIQKMQISAHSAFSRWRTGQTEGGMVRDLEEISIMAGATHLICKATQTPIFTSGIVKSSVPRPVEYCLDAAGRAMQFQGAHDSLMELYASLQRMDQIPISDLASENFQVDRMQGELYPEGQQLAPPVEDFFAHETGEGAQNSGSALDWAQLMEQLGVSL